MKSMYKIGIWTIVFLFTSYLAVSQDFPPWPVPDEAAAVENPIKPTKESLEAGMALYNLQCKACHGDQGKGDGLIKAANLTTESYLAQSDGAVFWKLQQGRGQMPSFKALPEEQLWNVTNYVRSLSIPPENIIKKDAIVKVFFNESAESKEITTEVFEITEDEKKVPAPGVKVNFGVKRYFGVMPIATQSIHKTNENGEITIPFMEEIIGDPNGNLTIIASIEGIDYNPADASEGIAWGSEKRTDYWTERRALWKNNDYVPIWLLISFIGGALAVWGTIGYVGLLVFKIKRIGDKVS